MKKLLFIVLLAIAANAQAETFTWNIGTPNASDVTAVLNTNDSSLTISGNGKMQNFSYDDIYLDCSTAPWSRYYGSRISKVLIEDGVTNIGTYAFWEFFACTSVTIPNSVTVIENSAFFYCESLTSVTIPNSVTVIGHSAFSYCESLTSVTIPDSVTVIYSEAFSFCESLTSVTIPNSVTIIQRKAFENCTSLTSITIPNSVTYIGPNAFSGCNSLDTVYFNADSCGYVGGSYNGGVIDDIWLSANNTVKLFVIGENVKHIPSYLCYQQRGLESITIPNSVTSIGKEAFAHCRLTSVIIGNGVTSIGKEAFAHCPLTSVIIGNGVTSIGSRAFEECIWLTSVTIPNSVTSIGEYAFVTCHRIDTVKVFWQNPLSVPWNIFAGAGLYIRMILIIPQGTLDAYRNAPVWKDFLLVEATQLEVETEIQTTETSVEIEWEAVTDAAEYVLIVYKDGVEVARVSFDANGNIVSKTAGKAAGSFSYNLTDLSAGTTYTYTLTAYDAQGYILAETEDVFTTLGQSVSAELSDLISEAETMPLRAYPNPTSSEITISPTSTGSNIDIYNSMGLCVGTYKATAEQTTLNLQGFPAGIYFVKIAGKTAKIVKR